MKDKKQLAMPLFLAFLFVVWGGYRFLTRNNEWVDELIFKPLIWIFPVLFIVKKIEKKSLETVGLTTKNLFRNLYIGWGIGALFAFEGIMTNAFKYGGVAFSPESFKPAELIMLILISFFTAFSEELAFRGYILTRLNDFLKNSITAIILTAILFSLLHIPIALFVLHYSLVDLISFEWVMFVMGVVNGYLFIRMKSIVVPVMSHSLWNLAIVLFR